MHSMHELPPAYIAVCMHKSEHQADIVCNLSKKIDPATTRATWPALQYSCMYLTLPYLIII